MTAPQDTEEDLRIFDILCGPEMSEGGDMITTLRSELAALQYKRDSLLIQLQETKCQLKKREEKAIQLESEIEHLKEQAARQNVVIASLRKRIQELEERERTLAATQGRTEMSLNTLQRESRYHEEKASELERKVSTLELELNTEEKNKLAVQNTLSDLVRQLESTLGGIDVSSKSGGFSHLIQEREKLTVQQHMFERDLTDLREKLANATRSINAATGDMQVQDVTIRTLRDELKQKEDKSMRLETELRHLLESLAIQLSTPIRFVESNEVSIKDKVRDLINEAKEKSLQVDSLHEKVVSLRDQMSRLNEQKNEDIRRIKDVQDDKLHVEGRLHKTEVELTTCQALKEGLRRDKAIFVTFLERLARALNMEEISREVGVDLHTESMLLRAEQLARLESDKLADKSAVVYQLQRRVRNLRDQLQRRDLHLDLLRRKLTLQEDSHRTKGLLQAERDEANLRVKKMNRQIEKLQVQLNEARALSRDLKLQLAECGDFKMSALERGRKVEELQKRLADSEMLRSRCTRKCNLLKDQVRVTGESAEEIRVLGEGVASALRDEISTLRSSLFEANREKNSLGSLRNTLCTVVGLPSSCADYELISRVTKMADAHREFTKVSRRYDEPPAVSPRYNITDDSGFLDPLADDIDSDINSIYNKRPSRSLLP
ncbi:coiled-coil domain-containing protein 170 isoform X3 [Rhodnius prolixus]|uniref:coiled-coil domain-containing protein 170 isoform X3 n=1 Tax=Rhodnius prolixus TaxID=13249 RepID=UPI003D188DB2